MPLSDLVVVVLTDDGTASLEELVAACPVWAVRTPANEAVAERVWALEPKPDPRERGLTLFVADDSPEESLLSVIDEIELHHGPASGAPAIRTLEVLGANPTDAVRATLLPLGLTRVERTTTGFVAQRGRQTSVPLS